MEKLGRWILEYDLGPLPEMHNIFSLFALVSIH